MKLRSRLALAFFVLSVLPLGVVTAYSYYSSASAMKRAEETQADRMALEMSNRVNWVVTDIGDRVDRLWRLRSERSGAAGADDDPATDAAAATRLRDEAVTLLAEAAPIVEQIDVVPTAPAAPPAPGSALRPAPPPDAGRGTPRRGLSVFPRRPGTGGARGPLPPAPIQRLPRFTIDFRKAVEIAASQSTLPELQVLSPDSVAAWTRAIQRQADRAQQLRVEITAAVRTGGVSPAGDPLREMHETERQQHMIALASGQPLRFSLHRGTEVVGQVNATLSRKRLIETVLSLARRDRGEVPFVVDADGQIATMGAEATKLLATMRLETNRLAGDGSPLAQTLGDYVVVMRRDPSGIVFGIARPIGDSLREMRRASLVNLGLGALLIAGAFIAIVPLASRLTRDLGKLTEGVRSLDRGDRSARVAVDSNDEMGELARAFNQMAVDLASHEKMLVQQERLRRELELCRQIQNEMLPHGRLKLGLTEVTGVSIPAKEVGGDFFNYFVLPDGSLALLVGDVSGKGVGAALLMANIQATLRAKLPLEDSLPLLVDTVDRDIAANTPLEVYLTLFVGILDPGRQILRYVNAGHNPQYILRVGGSIDSLASTGLPVGLLPGRGYEERSLAVGAGDLLFLYTDGAVEVEDEAGEMFGADRLQQLLRSHATAGVDELLAGVESGLRAFRGAAEPFDDATMMAMRLGAL